MAVTFPTGLDDFPDVATLGAAGRTLDDVDGAGKKHSALLADLGLAVEKLETKVGIDGSADGSSLDAKLAALGTTSAVRHASLGLGAALPSTIRVFEVSSNTAESDGTVRLLGQVHDGRSFTANQTGTGIGNSSGALHVETLPSVAAGVTADYNAITVAGIGLGGAGKWGVAAAYSTHFDLTNDAGADVHAGYLAHIGVIALPKGIVQDQVSFGVEAMNALPAAGLAATTLAASMTAGATTMQVASATALAGSDYAIVYDTYPGRAQITWGELVKITGGSGTTTLTVQRAQGGSTAVSHASGLTVAPVNIARATGFRFTDATSRSAAMTWGMRVGNFPSQHRGPLGIGGATTETMPAARLDLREAVAGQDVERVATAAPTGTDDVMMRVVQSQCNTTNATANAGNVMAYAPRDATLARIHHVELMITWHRTGGTAGATDDGGILRVMYALKVDPVAHTISNITGSPTILYQTGTQTMAAPTINTAFFSAFGSLVFQVTGLANTNITWHCTARICEVGA